MKKTMITAAALLAGTMLLTSCGSKTAMTVGDLKITQGDIEIVTEAYFQQYGDYDLAKEEGLKAIEESALAYEIAKANGVSDLTEEENSQLIQGKASFALTFGSTSEYKKALKKAGANDEIIKMVVAQPLYEMKIIDDSESAEPTDDELKAFFKENFIRAQHVLFLTDNGEDDETVKARAENVLERVNNGESFDELVQNLSEDPGSQSYPDGYVFTDGDMVSEFEESAKSIQPGEYTICKTDYGYHVIKRLALDESDSKFNDLFEENRYRVQTLKQNKDTRDKIQNMADELGITVTKNEDVINAIPSPTPIATAEPTEVPSAEPTEAPSAEPTQATETE